MKAILLVATLVTCAPATSAAEVAPSADGSFTSRTFTMPVSTAMAFRGKSLIDKTDVIVVAISNGDFRTDWFATFFDRRRAIERRMRDKETAVVYLEFKPDGAYRGLSYYFAQGNGCGYCGGNLGVTSTVKLASGRIAGSLKSKDESRTFDVVFNLPVTPDDHGAPLPPDGGAPGKAYMGYHAALVKRDVKTLRPFVSDEMREFLDRGREERQARRGNEIHGQRASGQIGADHQRFQQGQPRGIADRRRNECNEINRRSRPGQRGRELARRRRIDRRGHAVAAALDWHNRIASGEYRQPPNTDLRSCR